MSDTKRILLVDDEEIITRNLQLYLEATGRYQVRAINDSTRALDAAVEFRPHLAILDIVMPELDGAEVAAKFKAHPDLGRVPVVFLTAIVKEAELGGQGKVIGGYPFLAKPVDPDDLIALIDPMMKG